MHMPITWVMQSYVNLGAAEGSPRGVAPLLTTELTHLSMARSKQSARKRSLDTDTAPSHSKRIATSAASLATVWDDAEFEKLVHLPVPEDAHACQVEVRTGQRCDSSVLKDGALLYRYARIVVLNKQSDGGALQVRNQDLHAEGEDADWSLGSRLIDQQCWSPDQFTQVVPVTMTEMAAKIKDEVGDCVCKVEFTKQPEAAAMAELLQKGAAMIESSGLSAQEKKKRYKQLHQRSLQGDYRIMRGYLLRAENQQMCETDTGMIRFIDAELMAEGKHCERQVNVRAIKALTFKLVKYVLKS